MRTYRTAGYAAIRSSGFTLRYGEGQAASLKVKDVCNWLLHSYVWGVAGYADQKGFAGFLVASDFDKEKFVHFVSFGEWQKVIDAAIKNGAF